MSPRPASPSGPDPAALQQVVDHVGGALATAGFPPLAGRVFAALMATDDGRLTAADLAELLAVSPAGVSGAVRYLTQLRMIRRERERGSRRDVYVVMDDAWHDVLMQGGQIYAPIITALVEGIGTVGGGSRAGRRLALSVEFLEFIQREMNGMGARWEEYRAGRG